MLAKSFPVCPWFAEMFASHYECKSYRVGKSTLRRLRQMSNGKSVCMKLFGSDKQDLKRFDKIHIIIQSCDFWHRTAVINKLKSSAFCHVMLCKLWEEMQRVDDVKHGKSLSLSGQTNAMSFRLWKWVRIWCSTLMMKCSSAVTQIEFPSHKSFSGRPDSSPPLIRRLSCCWEQAVIFPQLYYDALLYHFYENVYILLWHFFVQQAPFTKHVSRLLPPRGVFFVRRPRRRYLCGVP